MSRDRVLQKHFRTIAFLGVILLTPIFSLATDSANNSAAESNESSSLEWDWRWFFAAAATTMAHGLDDPIYDGFGNINRTPTLDRSMHLSERYGGLVAPTVGFLSFPIIWAIGANHENRWYLRSQKIFASVASYTILATTLKFIAGRHRPYQGGDSTAGSPFSTKYSSFPSGHTGTAFAFSTSLAMEFDSYFIKIPLFAAAALTGFSRMYDNKHWFSDTVAATFLGCFAAFYSENYFGPSTIQQRDQKQEARWQLFPSISHNQMTTTLVGKFF